jgi:hypothetical protein
MQRRVQRKHEAESISGRRYVALSSGQCSLWAMRLCTLVGTVVNVISGSVLAVDGLVGGAFELGDALVGGGELVFEADDADGRGKGHVLVE